MFQNPLPSRFGDWSTPECQATSHFHWLANEDVGAGGEVGLTQGREGFRGNLTEELPRRKTGVASAMAGTNALMTLENFINGKFVPCNSYIDSYDPSTGEVYCRVPNSGKEEVSGAPGWCSRLSTPWFRLMCDLGVMARALQWAVLSAEYAQSPFLPHSLSFSQWNK